MKKKIKYFGLLENNRNFALPKRKKIIVLK
jgi:hypothetical protein